MNAQNADAIQTAISQIPFTPPPIEPARVTPIQALEHLRALFPRRYLSLKAELNSYSHGSLHGPLSASVTIYIESENQTAGEHYTGSTVAQALNRLLEAELAPRPDRIAEASSVVSHIENIALSPRPVTITPNPEPPADAAAPVLYQEIL